MTEARAAVGAGGDRFQPFDSLGQKTQGLPRDAGVIDAVHAFPGGHAFEPRDVADQPGIVGACGQCRAQVGKVLGIRELRIGGCGQVGPIMCGPKDGKKLSLRTAIETNRRLVRRDGKRLCHEGPGLVPVFEAVIPLHVPRLLALIRLGRPR
jgi:hypothetical protein